MLWTKTVFIEEETAADAPQVINSPAPMWCFRLDGVNPELLMGATVDGLLRAQCQTFQDRGDVPEEAILRQFPLLCAKPGMQDSMWSDEQELFTTFD